MVEVWICNNLQHLFENFIVKLNGYQDGHWGLACGLETYSPGTCKYPRTKILYKTSTQLWLVVFFSKDNHLELLGGSDTAVWVSLKSNSLWTISLSEGILHEILSLYRNVATTNTKL